MRLRRRVGSKEELAQQRDLVVLDPQQYKGRWNEFFGNDRPIYAELGMGKGKFISEMSLKYPDINFIGIDMYDELIHRASMKARELMALRAAGYLITDGIEELRSEDSVMEQRLAGKIAEVSMLEKIGEESTAGGEAEESLLRITEEENRADGTADSVFSDLEGQPAVESRVERNTEELIARVLQSLTAESHAPDNLALVLFNIERIEEVFAESELARIYLNFSDPWPKTRHANRRLSHPKFLHKYAIALNGEGEIHFKTDSRSLFEFSLNAFAELRLPMRNISLDLHKEGNPPGNVMTEYESKFSAKGMPIFRCEVTEVKSTLADKGVRE